MIVKSIPKRERIDRDTFSRWLANPRSPLVLTGMMAKWPAMEKWSFDYFARQFGDFPVVANAPQFADLAKWSVNTTLADYVAYLENPDHIAGEWTVGDIDSLRSAGLSLYAGNFNPAHPVRGRPDEVFKDVPRLPKFIECWFDMLDPEFVEKCQRLQSHQFVYLSIAGGITPLHHDFWETHAFLAQICGKKRAVLFHPKYMDELYREPTGDVPTLMRDPAFDHMTCWSAELEPGQILIIPSNWLHWVETLTPSITYSIDWIDGSNWQAYVAEGQKALETRGLWP
ncbi:MAG: hypothetical protein Tsb0019_08990 [Roseibium sp.]